MIIIIFYILLFFNISFKDFCLLPEVPEVNFKTHLTEISNVARIIRDAPHISLARTVFAHYDLGEVLEARRFELGYVNEPFYVKTTKGEYVIRASKEVRGREELLFDYSLLRYLESQNFPVPHIYNTKDGNFFVEIDGVKYLVYEYIGFEQLNWGDFKDARLKSIARLIAEYHSLVKNFVPEGKKERLSIMEDLNNIETRLRTTQHTLKERGATNKAEEFFLENVDYFLE